MNRAPFTQEQIKRALSAARKIDPGAVLEVAPDGTIRILPAAAVAVQDDPYLKWKRRSETDAQGSV